MRQRSRQRILTRLGSHSEDFDVPPESSGKPVKAFGQKR